MVFSRSFDPISTLSTLESNLAQHSSMQRPPFQSWITSFTGCLIWHFRSKIHQTPLYSTGVVGYRRSLMMLPISVYLAGRSGIISRVGCGETRSTSIIRPP
jgi:hypothetical protein